MKNRMTEKERKRKRKIKQRRASRKGEIYSEGIIDEKTSNDERKQYKKNEKWRRQKEQKIRWESIRREE